MIFTEIINSISDTAEEHIFIYLKNIFQINYSCRADNILKYNFIYFIKETKLNHSLFIAFLDFLKDGVEL